MFTGEASTGVVVFELARAYFGDLRRSGAHISSLASPVLAQARKILKKSQKFQKRLNASECCKRIQMHPSRSEQVPARLSGYENLENLANTSQKLRENFAKLVRVPSLIRMLLELPGLKSLEQSAP